MTNCTNSITQAYVVQESCPLIFCLMSPFVVDCDHTICTLLDREKLISPAILKRINVNDVSFLEAAFNRYTARYIMLFTSLVTSHCFMHLKNTFNPNRFTRSKKAEIHVSRQLNS